MAEVVRGCLRLPTALPRKPPHHLVKCKTTTQTDHSPALCQTTQQKQSGHANLPGEQSLPGWPSQKPASLGTWLPVYHPAPCSTTLSTLALQLQAFHPEALTCPQSPLGKPWPLPCTTESLTIGITTTVSSWRFPPKSICIKTPK